MVRSETPMILSLPQAPKLSSGSQPTQATSMRANVSVVTILSILDHWIHRDEHSQRVVGALLGTRSEDGSQLQITDSFPIVLMDNDSSIDVDFAAAMYQLRRRANPKELVLGWYSTGSTLDEASPALHDWFEANLISTTGNFYHGIHLLVNTDLDDESPSVQGYIGLPVASLTEGNQGRMFVPFPAVVTPTDHEVSGLEVITAAAHPESDNFMDVPSQMGPGRVKDRLCKLHELVDRCIEYVMTIIDQFKRKVAMSGEDAVMINRLGHLLAKIVAARTDLSDVTRMETEIRDLKTILELASQARKQIMVTELVMYGSASNAY